jgi:hypothetical protein
VQPQHAEHQPDHLDHLDAKHYWHAHISNHDAHHKHHYDPNSHRFDHTDIYGDQLSDDDYHNHTDDHARPRPV